MPKIRPICGGDKQIMKLTMQIAHGPLGPRDGSLAMTLVLTVIPLFPFPNQLPTAVTTPGHPVDWAKPAIVYDH